MTKLSRSNKAEKAAAIQQVYITARNINACVGNELTAEYEDNQFALTESEFLETVKAINENDIVELHDGLGDILTTLSELVCIVDGDDYLTKNAPLYLNESERSVDDLVYEGYRFFRERNYVDALGAIEDAVDSVEGDIVAYLHAVNKSNLSKFPEVGTVDPEVEADKIEEKGRYKDVYFEEGELLGKQVYIFKSKYDSKNNERFPKGKYLKPSSFREPQELLEEV